jgi:hypothetical protein
MISRSGREGPGFDYRLSPIYFGILFRFSLQKHPGRFQSGRFIKLFELGRISISENWPNFRAAIGRHSLRTFELTKVAPRIFEHMQPWESGFQQGMAV